MQVTVTVMVSIPDGIPDGPRVVAFDSGYDALLIVRIFEMPVSDAQEFGFVIVECAVGPSVRVAFDIG